MTQWLTRRSAFLGIASAAVASANAFPAAAQGAWPSRPVRIVVPFSPGGSNDILARALAERLSPMLGQPFVVENRAGAGGAIGADFVAKSAPDGHTLLFVSSSLTTNAAVQRLPYDAVTDLTAVARVAVAPMIVTVGRNFPGRTMADLVLIARERPGRVRFGTTGPGDIGFLSAQLIMTQTGTQMEPISYRGITEAQLDVAAGRVEIVVTTVASARSLLDAGELRMLAVTADRRDADFPDVPTSRESGVDVIAGLWWGVFGPASLPEAVVSRLHGAVGNVVGEPAYQRILANGGALPASDSQANFAATVRADVDRWSEVARRAGIASR